LIKRNLNNVHKSQSPPNNTLDPPAINVSPNFFNASASIFDIQETWFLNLSNIQIPKEVQLLLQLGNNFNFPSTNIKQITLDLIKNIENSIEKLNKTSKIEARNKIIAIIENMNNIHNLNKTDRTLLNWFSLTKKFVKDNNNLIITRADKGNTTVVIDKIDYKQKMLTMLSDTNTYKIIKKDLSRKITEDLRTLLVIPRAYGLPKIHKTGYPLRIIVSSINSTLHPLALFLHKIINNNINNHYSDVKNSQDLVKKLKNIDLTTNIKLASLDVVSLFTNIP